MIHDRELRFYTVSEEYIDYLKKYDYRVSDNLLSKNQRPFIGVVLSIDEMNYYVPLTSPKFKHKLMNESIDFMKIKGGSLGAINLNNMIPVPKDMVKPIIFREMPIQTPGDLKYKNLLVNQYRWCKGNKEKISKRANRLYRVVISGKNEQLSMRCCDFSLLEKQCRKFEIERDYQRRKYTMKKKSR